jgi:hypothetical protein
MLLPQCSPTADTSHLQEHFAYDLCPIYYGMIFGVSGSGNKRSGLPSQSESQRFTGLNTSSL